MTNTLCFAAILELCGIARELCSDAFKQADNVAFSELVVEYVWEVIEFGT